MYAIPEQILDFSFCAACIALSILGNPGCGEQQICPSFFQLADGKSRLLSDKFLSRSHFASGCHYPTI